jgi:phosphate transport system substrate-binding protein
MTTMAAKSTGRGMVATLTAAGVLAALALTIPQQAFSEGAQPVAAAGADQAPAGLVQWLLPARTTAIPQTKEQAESSVKNGRTTPTPELLQPSIDPALTPYKHRPDLKLSGTYKGAASDVLPGIVNLWIERFKKLYPGVDISIAPPYAGSLGAKELVKQTLDFAFVSRELKPDDLVEFNAKFGYPPTSVPVSGGTYRHFGFLDAVAFFVNKDNPLEHLTFEQLDAIFSSTRHRGGTAITTWGQLGLTGEWADKPIHTYGIKPWNGFEEFVRQRVLSTDKRGEWAEGVHFEKVVFPMAKLAANDRYGIGYSGLAYIDAGVKMLPLAKTASGPFIAPSYENVALASYPLARLVYMNINKQPGKPLPPALEEFLRFILSKDGQQAILDQAIYLPLRAPQVQTALGLLEN